jgi:membrane glycosyltransferase
MPLFLILLWVAVILFGVGALLQTLYLTTGRKHQQFPVWSRVFLGAGILFMVMRMIVMFSS